MKEQVIIYQAGKVGSSSLANSLTALPGLAVYQVHRLRLANAIRHLDVLEHDVNYLDQVRGGSCYRYCKRRRVTATARSLFLSFRIRVRMRTADRIRVITLVRDPVARNISSFFENIRYFIPGSGMPSRAQLEKVFKNRFHHANILEWFDREFRPVLGVDVFDLDFDAGKGYGIFRKGRTELLVIRLEKLDLVWNDALQATGIRLDRLDNDNVAAAKPYNEAYRDFRSQVRFERPFLEYVYNHKFSSRFMEPAERRELLEKWTRE
jgi:hypothetical protein